MSIRADIAMIVSSLLLLAGCTVIDLDPDYVLDPALYAQVIDQASDNYPEIDPLFLDDEIKQWLHERMEIRGRGDEYLVSTLQDLLYGEEYLNIQYSDAKTHTAAEVFHAREGNCLSVMNLYIAMARYVGVDANFQTVEVQPSWDRRGDLLVVSQHINATGRLSARNYYVVDFTPEISLQSMTESIVSDAVARSLYFNNLGVEALVAGDTGQALAYIKNALFIDSSNSFAWNNLGTAYRRLGNEELAEFSYHFSFNLDNTNATAVNNLVKLFRAQGDEERARRYESVIDRFNRRNPHFQYARGKRAYEQGNFNTARLYFQRAIRLKPYEPSFHTGLAMAYVQLGELNLAQDAREEAQSVLAVNSEIYRPSDRRLRIFDQNSILNSSSPGLTIQLRRGTPVEPAPN